MGRRHQAEHVRTDRVKSHVTQVQQAGVTHHDVQAQSQQHVKQGHVGDTHPGVAERLQQQGQQHHGNGANDPGLFVVLHGDSFRHGLPRVHRAGRMDAT